MAGYSKRRRRRVAAAAAGAAGLMNRGVTQISEVF
jgi:hypothetical protein